MARMPFPLAGPTYTSRSLPVSSQVTRNFYVEVDQQGNENVVLMPFPGLKLFSTGSAGLAQGLEVLNDELYSVSGGALYKVDSNGAQTSKGNIASSRRVSLAVDGSNLVIATGFTKPYAFDGTTLTLGTDEDLPLASTATYINQTVVYDGANQDIVFADLNDPLTVDSSNILVAKAKPDDMKAVYAYKQQVYGFGAQSIQPSYNTGVGNPPYALINNSTQEVGIGAVHSLASNKNFTYFLGSDLVVYQLSGVDMRPIGNPAIGQAIHNYVVTNDAFGVCFTLDNANFYMMSFPSANETWLYSEQSGLWTSLAFGTSGDQHLISDYAFAYGKHLVSDRRNGNIYELDFDTYTDNGDTIKRRRDTISISGKTFGKPGYDVFMSRLGLIIEPGTSLVTDIATIMMEFSDDNGRSWSTELWAAIGEQGDYTYEVEWHQLGRFRNRMFRFTMSDPIKWVLISAYADVELSSG